MVKLTHVLDATAHAALSPAYRELYKEQGGKFVLDTDAAEGLQNALDGERQARQALEKQLAGYGQLTPDQAKVLEEAAAKAQREKDFASGNFDKILAETNEKHRKDLDLRDQREKGLVSSLQSALIDAEAVRAIATHGGNATLLLPIIKANAKLQPIGDTMRAVIIGEKGGPLLKAGAKGAEDFMDMNEYVAGLKADKVYAGAFAAAVGSGTGSPRAMGRDRIGNDKPMWEKLAEQVKQEGVTRVS